MADWHPILNAIEVAGVEWWMPDPLGEPYAVVKLVEVQGERGYRVVTYAPASVDRPLIGYYGNLRAATHGSNLWFVQSQGWNGSPFIGWKGAQQQQRPDYR